MGELQAFTELIKSVGFPIAITVYVIVRMDSLMGSIRDQLTIQNELLRSQKEILDRIEKNGGTK